MVWMESREHTNTSSLTTLTPQRQVKIEVSEPILINFTVALQIKTLDRCLARRTSTLLTWITKFLVVPAAPVMRTQYHPFLRPVETFPH